ncbi:hypothetical protein SEA_MAGRITTE_125 [Microbacterium phage Magritte]|nr:hypothetical protein SEA_MAGRITTE_125 [Microbacterium phage Magritte]
MPVTHVRSTHTFEAVHTRDDDWEDVVRGWMADAEAPEEAIEGYMRQLRDGVKEAGLAAPWLMNAGDRGLSIISPLEFVKFFEDVAPTDVLGEVYGEMKRADEKGFDAKHDDSHNTAHFVKAVHFYLDPLAAEGNTLPDATKRAEFIKVAGIAISAVEKIDRAQDVGTFAV